MGMKEKTGLAKVRARSTAIAATVFLLPTILLIIVYMIYPIIDTFVISMYKWNGISSDRVFIGFTNWQNLLVDGEFWTSFGHNVIVMVFSCPPSRIDGQKETRYNGKEGRQRR